MLILPSDLDLTPHTHAEIGKRISDGARGLFEIIKHVPFNRRTHFPQILKNNNFSWSVRVTQNYAFIDFTKKSKALSGKEHERLAIFRQFFASNTATDDSMFKTDNARMVSMSGGTVVGTRSFGLGQNFSFCAWDTKNEQTGTDGKTQTTTLDLVFVVGFGPDIPADDPWPEFDSLIRVTMRDWSAQR